jgi:hypothetical protein
VFKDKILANMTQVSDVAPGPLVSLCLQIFIWYLVHCFLIHTKIQIKFEYGSDPLIFHEVMALGLGEKSWIISFKHFFLIFIWYLVHCFAILRYRLNLSLALIDWFFTKLWPLDFEKKSRIITFPDFFLSA